MKNNIASVVVIFCVFSIVSKADVVNPLLSQGDYNLIAFGNFEQKGGSGADIEGNVAIRGNAIINNQFTFGGQTWKAGNAPAGLVVGGAIQGSGISYQGSVAYYGPGSNTNHNGAPFWHNNNAGGEKVILAKNPLDFQSLYSDIKQFSDGLAKLDSTSGIMTTFNESNRNIILEGSGRHVLNIFLADWYEQFNSTTIDALYITGNSDAELLINIIGNDIYNEVTFVNGVELRGGIDGNNVLFNLAGVANLYNEANSTIQGSVLGYDTDLYMAGTIDGTGVFRDVTMTGNSEFHANNHYDGDFEPGASVPEPASMLIFGLGLGALPLVRRLRKKTA